MITGMNHTGFVVGDLRKAEAFYRDVIGMKVVRTFERTGAAISHVIGYENTHLKGVHLGFDEGPTLELIYYLSPASAKRPTEGRSVLGATHLALNVENIDETYERIVKKGGRKLNPPIDVAPGRRVCYLQDPDGNWLELVEAHD
jgi:glyoxylase I family protein